MNTLGTVFAAIPVRCRTNIDKYRREVWPECFSSPPVLGDTVRAKSGIQLQIVQIIHVHEADGSPSLEIELHTPQGFPIPQ